MTKSSVDFTDDKFNFFTPLEFEKGKDKNGKDVMKIKGVASTRDVDSDQEVLEPDGYILDKFLSTGFFNYNHRSSTDPSSIVGEPTNAFVKKGELIVEGVLYPDSKKAQDLYETIQVVSKNSKNRRMGMSIEGRALERDPLNKKRITKALITGCAITPTPKNAHTLVEVMKGEVDPWEKPEFDVVSKSDHNGGEMEYLIDVMDDSGYRRTVDTNFNIKVVKMDLADYGLTDTSYGVTAESLAGTKRGGKRSVRNNVGNDFFEKNAKKFSKSEIYHQIFTIFTTDIHKAKQIYGLLESIEGLNGNEMSDISQETIDKAAELFSITSKELEGETVKKADSSDDDEEDEEDVEKMKKALDEYQGKIKELEMKIAARSGKEENRMDAPDEDGGKITGAAPAMKGEEDDLNKGEETKEEEKIEKSETQEEPVGDFIQKSEVNDILKAEMEAFSTKLTDAVSEKLQAVGELYLGQKEAQEDTEGKLDGLTKAIETIQETVEEIAKSPVRGRQGIITKAVVERFKEENGEEAQVLSLSQNKRQVVDTLYELSNIEKGEEVDQEFLNAVQDLEAAGGFSNPRIAQRLKTEHNIHLVN